MNYTFWTLNTCMYTITWTVNKQKKGKSKFIQQGQKNLLCEEKMWHWIFQTGSTQITNTMSPGWLTVSLMAANRANLSSNMGKWYSHTHHPRCMCMYGLRDAMRQSQGNIVALAQSLVRWESLRENSSEEWGGVKKGQTRVALGHLSGSQQKKPESAGMQPEGIKNIFIWQLTRSGYSSVCTANDYKCWEAPESKLRNHTMCRMSLGACRDCVWEFMLCVFWDNKGRQGWSNLGGEQE